MVSVSGAENIAKLFAHGTATSRPIVVGRYFDSFGQDGDGWYFTERKVDIQMIGDVSTHLLVDPRQYDK